mgnify:FL=1
MSEQNLSLPIRGDKIGTIIYEDTVSSFEGNVVFDNEYHSIPNFYKLELINDVISVLRNEYERVNEMMVEERTERRAEMPDDEFAE